MANFLSLSRRISLDIYCIILTYNYFLNYTTILMASIYFQMSI